MTRCHAPIDVRRVGLDRRKLCDPRVVGRKVAYRIGCGGIAVSDTVFASGSPAEGAKRRDNGGKRLLGHNSFGHDAPGVEPSPGPPISLADSRVGALTLQQQGAPMAFKWNQGVERKAK
jgi:hypothetical protein